MRIVKIALELVERIAQGGGHHLTLADHFRNHVVALAAPLDLGDVGFAEQVTHGVGDVGHRGMEG